MINDAVHVKGQTSPVNRGFGMKEEDPTENKVAVGVFIRIIFLSIHTRPLKWLMFCLAD